MTTIMDTISELVDGGMEVAAVLHAIALGTRAENELTDMVFFARHPERQGRKIATGETGLAQEWLQIRDSLVRPALARLTASAAPTVTAPKPAPAGAPTGTDLLTLCVAKDQADYDKAGDGTRDTEGDGVAGYDCSGLLYAACRELGVDFPRGSYAQWKAIEAAGRLVPVPQALATPGAWLFLNRGKVSGNHVAIAVGDGDIVFEAKGHDSDDRQEIGYGKASQRRSKFTHGGLVPGIAY